MAKQTNKLEVVGLIVLYWVYSN